jgi:hypothetical protein
MADEPSKPLYGLLYGLADTPIANFNDINDLCVVDGGETGIRTLETVSRLHTFQACAFDHSATSPCWVYVPDCAPLCKTELLGFFRFLNTDLCSDTAEQYFSILPLRIDQIRRFSRPDASSGKQGNLRATLLD